MSRIVIDESRCKGCGLCTTACPFELIQMADHFNAKGYRPAEYIESCPAPDDSSAQENRCTGCANCAAMCPDVAITVYRTRSAARVQGTRVRDADVGQMATQKPGDPAERPGNKKNGRDRQTVTADTRL